MENIKKSNQKSKTIIKNNNNIKELKMFKQIMKEENINLIVFNSIYDLILLVFVGKKTSVVAYNLIDNKKLFEIKNANETINELKHYLDK